MEEKQNINENLELAKSAVGETYESLKQDIQTHMKKDSLKRPSMVLVLFLAAIVVFKAPEYILLGLMLLLLVGVYNKIGAKGLKELLAYFISLAGKYATGVIERVKTLRKKQ